MQKLLRTASAIVLFVLTMTGAASAQDSTQVTGTVKSNTGEPLWGVMVRVRGAATTATRTVTDQSGRYSITAPNEGVLTYALIGFRGTEQAVGGRSTIDVVMEQAPTVLQEVV